MTMDMPDMASIPSSIPMNIDDLPSEVSLPMSFPLILPQHS